MRRSQRLIATAVIIALSGVLAGCAGGMSSFDPSDLLDFLDTTDSRRADMSDYRELLLAGEQIQADGLE